MLLMFRLIMNNKKIFLQNFKVILFVVSVLLVVLSCCQFKKENNSTTQTYLIKTIKDEFNNRTEKINSFEQQNNKKFSDYNIPPYSQQPFVELNDNIPWFDKSDINSVAFEKYSELDNYGRCGTAFVCAGIETIPTEERSEIGSIKPSGWHTVKYDIIEGKYLYNRCHLIAYQLSGENANPKNLITGTRYLNVEGMLPFESMVADYIENTNNHVLYRVTPVFEKNNLLANGVIIEAYSIEDNGQGICFNVFCYNVQPGIKIDYKTGKSHFEEFSTKIYTMTDEDNWDLYNKGYGFYSPSLKLDNNEIYPYRNVAGEVDLYRLLLTLNQIGKAFLITEDFLENGNFYCIDHFEK